MDADAEQTRIEMVKRVYSAFNARDPDAVLNLVDAEFEWHPNPEEPEQQVARTPADVIAGLRDRWEGLPMLRTEIEEIHGDGTRVLATVRHEALLAGSDAPIERREVHVWSFREGRVAALREFATRAAALKALRG